MRLGLAHQQQRRRAIGNRTGVRRRDRAAVVTAIMMPLTFSVADGIALGFITYVALKAGTGKYREISISLWVLCAIFIAKFIFL